MVNAQVKEVQEITESITEKTVESIKVTKEAMEEFTETITNGVSVCPMLNIFDFTHLNYYISRI